uniref:tRNA methyltransferase 112 homolog n=1 Tax=Piliocolobus tephrosceles TaxID=591936 RepID=A0A8C9HXZ1_9PRIM
VIPKVEWAVFLEVADNLRLLQVPKGPVEGYEENEEFLRTTHHLLLEVEVMEGTLQGPESGCMFPISHRIPNMLLSEEEIES